MKKLIFILGICLLCAAIFAGGCLDGNNNSDNSSDNFSNDTPLNSNNSSNNTQSNSNNSSNNTPAIAPPVTPPADSTKFFGHVTDLQKVYGMPLIVLSNPKDQNFIFTNNSQTNFNLSDLQTRPYLEVYADTPVIIPRSEPIPVVVANIINIDHYMGEIVNVIPSSPERFSDIQSIEVKSWDGSVISPMVFRCNETQFFMDLQDIKIGTTVGVVYDENTVLESMPSQAKAYEFYYVSSISCN